MKLELIFLWKVKCINELFAGLHCSSLLYFLQVGQGRERESQRERDRQRETGRHVFLELFWSPSFGRVGLQEPRKPLWADSWAQLWPALDSETPPTFGSTRPA